MEKVRKFLVTTEDSRCVRIPIVVTADTSNVALLKATQYCVDNGYFVARLQVSEITDCGIIEINEEV
ncbi:MAG: hypothetical protein NC299_17925 [Lachnospiraceae bacterium]|nr:hypothetical protein [Ruminococcus sp.]MCM1277207.1 hypothetical protein [Lachnospiraceae bacterium]